MNILKNSFFVASLVLSFNTFSQVKPELYTFSEEDYIGDTELSDYDVERMMIDREIRKLEKSTDDLLIEDKKKNFRDIMYEDYVERDSKYEDKLKSLPKYMLEKTDIIQINF